MRKFGKFIRHFLFRLNYSFVDVMAVLIVCHFYTMKNWQFWAIALPFSVVSAFLTEVLVNQRQVEDWDI